MKRNMMSRILSAVAALVLVAGSTATSANAQSGNIVRIDNRSGYGLYHVYLSPTGIDRWGMDQLGTTVVSTGYTVRLLDRFPDGSYDLKLVDTDGDSCVVWNVRVDGNTTWNIYRDWLLNCEFH